ncbi:MAG: hypothetical protein QXX03_05765 [Nitrososphaerota archaeon]
MNNLTLTLGAIVAVVVFMFVGCFSAVLGFFLGFRLAELTEKFIKKRIERMLGIEDKNDI